MSVNWYLKRETNQFGPYTWEQLLSFAKNEIKPGDMVKSDDMEAWIAADNVPGLIAAPAEYAPPNPSADTQTQSPPPPPPSSISQSHIPSSPPSSNAAPVKKKKSKLKTTIIVIACVIGALALAFIGLVVAEMVKQGKDTNTSSQTQNNGSQQTQTQTQMTTFSDSAYGFSMSYPSDWVYEYASDSMVMFSGKEGSEAYYSTVFIQNLLSTKSGGTYDNLEAIYNDFKEQIASAGGQISEMRESVFSVGNIDLPAIAMESTFNKEGGTYKQMTVIIQRNENIFQQFSYTAPVSIYEKYIDTAQQMYNSLNLIN